MCGMFHDINTCENFSQHNLEISFGNEKEIETEKY